jgi:hypothetical protein
VEEAGWAGWAKNTKWASAAALAGWTDKGEKMKRVLIFEFK